MAPLLSFLRLQEYYVVNGYSYSAFWLRTFSFFRILSENSLTELHKDSFEGLLSLQYL